MRKIIFLVLLLIAIVNTANACEVKFNVSGEKKETFKPGEEVVIEVMIVYTHRRCEIDLTDSKFTFDGMKILGSTPWTEPKPGTYSRQVKILITDDGKKEATLTLTRKCQKEGGFGTIKLKKG